MRRRREYLSGRKKPLTSRGLLKHDQTSTKLYEDARRTYRPPSHALGFCLPLDAIMTPPQLLNSRESALEECERLLRHFDERAKRHKDVFVRYKYSSVALTVGVTVIAALQGIYHPTLFWAWLLPVVSG